MAVSMSPVEIVFTIPSFSLQHHTSHKFSNHRNIHIHMPFFLHVHVHAELIHCIASIAAPVKRQPAQKQRWTSQGRNTNTLCKEGQLKLFNTNTNANTDNYASLLQACTNIIQLKQFHAHMLRSGFSQCISLVTKLMSMYDMCGDIKNARLVFDGVSERDVFLWNVMIGAYTRNGFCEEALTLYNQMQWTGIQPNNFTFPIVLKACASMSALNEGKEIHDHIIRRGYHSEAYVGAALIHMYAKCGSTDYARQVFDKMSQRNVVSWTAMIAGYAQNGYANEALAVFNEMQLGSMVPDSVTMVSLLPACAHLGVLHQGKFIHNRIIRSGLDSDVSVRDALIDMYAKCGSIDYARQIFEKMSKRSLVSWTSMIAGYAQTGNANEALMLFHQMQLEGMTPDLVTIVSVLPACADLSALQQGKWIHAYTIRSGFVSDVFVVTALIDMYAKSGSIDTAHKLFDNMSKRNVISWNTMISEYAQHGLANESLALFHQMQLTDLTPDFVTIISVLQACAYLGDHWRGKRIHGYLIRSGFEINIVVQTALIDFYAKCRSVEVARHLFDRMPTKDTVAWSAMISAYVQNGYFSEGMVLFNQMQLVGVTLDSVTIVSVLPAFAHLASLQQGKMIHAYITKKGFETNILVGTALIDMYAKCGSIQNARQLFDRMPGRNVASWSAMISGYGMHGHGKDAVALFLQMQNAGMSPDDITFVSLLSACSHAGLLNEGWQYFGYMTQEYCITPRLEHYACMVDLLGRAGHLKEAQDFIEKMPLDPDAGVWGALLGACRIHSNVELGEHVARHLFDIEPENAANYVLLSNIYAAAGRWDDAANVRTMMNGKRLKKSPGCSLIEVSNRVHAFLVGDRSHPQSEKIYATLETLSGQMKEAGYVPLMNFALHDVEEEVKEHMLYSHSEKLAIAFGLINTNPKTPIQIMKNLRVCGDCHSATKFISMIVRREIIVRDANRFHNFKDGLCSCADYW
eukprot:Gb_00846 [translate_table: standard]